MKSLKFLMVACLIALVVSVIFTLENFMHGDFIFAGVGAVVAIVLFAVLTVLRRQYRIAKIMSANDFD
jgi:hypothetical protein